MTESFRDYIERREGELEKRISLLRAELSPIERELAEIRQAKTAIKPNLFHTGVHSHNLSRTLNVTPKPYASYTLKQLVTRALSEHFHNGATAVQLIDFFAAHWGRDIPRASLSPQLSRLKDDGAIRLDGKTWVLCKTNAIGPSEPRSVDDLIG